MKKVLKSMLLIILILSFQNVFAANMGELEFCKSNEVLKVFRLIAVLITIIKIVIPIIILIKGMISIFNAVVSEDDTLNKAIGALAKKLVVGIFVFFIPTIVYTLASLASDYDKTKSKFTECTKCMNSVKYCNSVIRN